MAVSDAYPHVLARMQKDLEASCGGKFSHGRLIRAKAGVYVYRGIYKGASAVAKYFEEEGDLREIRNYRILNENGIATIPVLAFGERCIVLEDVDDSEDWRLGIPEDLRDAQVAEGLGAWYFDLHEKGSSLPALHGLYCEYDSVTEENIRWLWERLPGAAETFRYIVARYGALREAIAGPSYTLTYNDFYWTNFIVRRDKGAALMFDYNLLGKGFRYADMRNVLSALSGEAAGAFTGAYEGLYREKHGMGREVEAHREAEIDRVVSCLFTLIRAFALESFPGWAEGEKRNLLEGSLLKDAKRLLG